MFKSVRFMMLVSSNFLLTACSPDKKANDSVEKSTEKKIEKKDDSKKENEKEVTTGASQGEDAVTSATVVPKDVMTPYKPKGFTKEKSKEKVMFVVADPREDSLTNDMANTAMAFFEEHNFEVEKRDLYKVGFDPVMTVDTFYNAKDGSGETPKDVATEQSYVKQAQHIIFVYPNWHDLPTPLIKGYMERVFAKQFAYKDGKEGLEGLLTDKDIFTIMNAGYLGGGQGYVGDGLGQDDKTWDKYMNAFKVFDDDTAAFWGVKNKGRFVNDQSPKNNSKEYQKEITSIREALKKHLEKTYLTK